MSVVDVSLGLLLRAFVSCGCRDGLALVAHCPEVGSSNLPATSPSGVPIPLLSTEIFPLNRIFV